MTASLRDTDEIARRAIALCLLAGRAEGMEPRASAELAAHFGVVDSLRADERRFFFSPSELNAEEAQRVQWGYEAAHALLWATGHARELGPLDAPASPRATSALITSAQSTEALVAAAQPRPAGEVQSEAKRLRELWTEVAHAGAAPEGVHPPVLFQRVRALEWALGGPDEG